MTAFQGRFAGQVAVITGGASGIGRSVAERLMAEGALVSVWDISEAALDSLGSTVSYKVHVDQSDEEAVRRATEKTVQKLGGIDVLVVSAGITGPITPLTDYPGEAWRRVMDVNLNGAFYVNRAVAPHMVAKGYGRIVNIASVAAKEGNPNASAYSASKAAVIAMTKSLAKELVQHGVTANVVTPTAVRTPIFSQMTQSHIDFMLSKIPMGRFLEVNEAAAMVAWLASEDCSFTTSSVFDLSGGRATY